LYFGNRRDDVPGESRDVAPHATASKLTEGAAMRITGAVSFSLFS
jgi:hypothetical protein